MESGVFIGMAVVERACAKKQSETAVGREGNLTITSVTKVSILLVVMSLKHNHHFGGERGVVDELSGG